jgi:hypothetical protein
VPDVEKVSNVKLNLELEQENTIVGFGDEIAFVCFFIIIIYW